MANPKRTPRKNSSPPDDPATRYAKAVVAGEVCAGPLVRNACARHLRDLNEQVERGLEWRPEVAGRVFEFFRNVLRLPDSDKPFVLQPWQEFIVGNLFGWHSKDGTRRFRTAYIETGKGSGKSPMLGGIGLYMLTADGEQGAEVYAAAVTRDQAKILFRDAVSMVDAAPALGKRLTKSGHRDVFNLAHEASGSFFRPISSEGRGLDGKRVHCALIDEIHEHPSGTVVDKMRAGTKARRQALIVEITNSGVDRTSICYQHHEYSERVVAPPESANHERNDTWFAYVCALDEGEDPFEDEGCWPKANPNLGVSIDYKYLREQVAEAKGMPGKASMVRRLNFCQWVGAENPWISEATWRSVVAEFEIDAGRECIGAALDLSGTRDLTALALAFAGLDGVIDAAVEFWTPKDTLIERSRDDKVPYDVWVDQDELTATPGRAVDYGFVAQRLLELQQDYGLKRVAFDPYRIKYLEKELDELGIEIELVPHGQGFYRSAESLLWMCRSIEALEKHIDDKTVRIHKSPVLDYCAASAQTEEDAKGNRIFTKRKSKGRIDGVVALAMVAGLIDGTEDTGESVYEQLARAA